MANYAVKANDTRGRIGKKLEPRRKPDARKVHEMNEERKRNNLKRQGVEYTPQPYPNRTYSEKVNDMNEERKRYNQRKKQYENAFGR